ncbi:MAG: hypothetical protein KJ915_02500 [Candidatus Omnitrophica bacterium]|nr:hypothetical protein [Candidatus Omnitrophota bacterium]
MGYNKIEDSGRRNNINDAIILNKQRFLLGGSSLLYALLFLLPILTYVYNCIGDLCFHVKALEFLKSIPFFFIILFLIEGFLATVIYNFLKIYIEKMNTAIGFFKKIGRSVRDGSKLAVQASSDLGSKVVSGVKHVSRSAVKTTKTMSKKSVKSIGKISGKAVVLFKSPFGFILNKLKRKK